jgi:hypothetical protein
MMLRQGTTQHCAKEDAVSAGISSTTMPRRSCFTRKKLHPFDHLNGSTAPVTKRRDSGTICGYDTAFVLPASALHASLMVCYAALTNPTLSLMIPAPPMGSGFGSAMSTNSILPFHTLRKKSSTTWVVSCSPGQRRYPKPKGASRRSHRQAGVCRRRSDRRCRNHCCSSQHSDRP